MCIQKFMKWLFGPKGYPVDLPEPEEKPPVGDHDEPYPYNPPVPPLTPPPIDWGGQGHLD